MIESLKIIHVCDHKISNKAFEEKISTLKRQESRLDEVISRNDTRMLYSDNWEDHNISESEIVKATSLAGETLTLSFYGDNACIFSRKDPYGGRVQVFIDGSEYGVVDLYSPTPTKNEPLIDICDMVHGMHIIQVKLLQEANDLSGGNLLMIESAILKELNVKDIHPYETIAEGEIVCNISLVSQTRKGVFTSYMKDRDFKLIGGNKIRWIGIKRPHPDTDYIVHYTRARNNVTAYNIDQCPRCYGLGWYGAFNNLTTKIPEKTTGIYRIAEDIIKIMLTPLREDGYGAEFIEMNKHLYMSSNMVEEIAASEINRIERYYKRMQAQEIAKGALYEPEDTLYAIIVNELNFNVDASQLNIDVTVYNNVGQEHQARINI